MMKRHRKRANSFIGLREGDSFAGNVDDVLWNFKTNSYHRILYAFHYKLPL